ncbi:MAG: nucleotidyltransferase [Eubacteriaceae bacterium]
MKILSIVAEYNPFHNGHLYHLETSKEITKCTHSIAIMSGNFLQRGEPALMDKWIRAKTAIENGIDLVIELPVVYSCQSAEIFAYGAVKILNDLDIVDNISFGCEDNDLNKLKSVANLLVKEPQEYKNDLKFYLDQGISYPKARQLAVKKFDDVDGEILSTSNNILAVEYLKWLIKLDSSIEPIPIKRANASYHCDKVINNFAGATYIRNQIKENNNIECIKDVIPKKTLNNMKKYMHTNEFNKMENYFEIIISQLLKLSPEKLIEYFDVKEGLENRIINSIYNSNNTEELIDNIITKRYTSTRIKRILLNCLLEHKELNMRKVFNTSFTPYVRILAFNDKGKEIIKRIKDKEKSIIITNVSKKYNELNNLQRYCIEKDILSTKYFFLKSNIKKMNNDYYKKPEIVK